VADYFIRFDWGASLVGRDGIAVPLDTLPVPEDLKALLHVLIELWEEAARLHASGQPVTEDHKTLFRFTYNLIIPSLRSELAKTGVITLEEYPPILA
jgi:hypothetical protein